jgi:SET domain-containing protein
MNVWCKIAPSNVHGVGVFAIRDIPQNTVLHCRSDQRKWLTDPIDNLPKEVQELIKQRWPYYDKFPYLNPNDDARLISFMNHSDTPNYDKFTDTSLVAIKQGEEVFEDYGFTVL